MRLTAETLFAGAIGVGVVGVMTGLYMSRAEADGNGAGTPANYTPRTGPSFVNWESAHVHPMDMTPDRSKLLVVNTAAATLEVFALSSFPGAAPRRVATIPVGLDPVTVRARSNTEAWVVNFVSDTVSVVDLATGAVVRTLDTADEPADVVFGGGGAGGPTRAFVTCSQADQVLVFTLANLAQAPGVIPIVGEEPRAMQVSADGSKIYAAVFKSGNGTTILGGGSTGTGTVVFPPNAVSDPLGPYAGVNPPPNTGTTFTPAQRAGNPAAPRVGLIVKKNGTGQWMDDNGRDWTSLVSGPNASRSGRLPGWDLADNDLAVIDANTLGVQYAKGLMNLCMAVGINPSNGRVTVVGTEAMNHVRFEPNITGKFTRVHMATVDPSNLTASTVTDLNPHLNYTVSSLPPAERARAIGDPRAVVWNSAGTRGYVSGMGSNNVIVINAAGARAGLSQTIEVGEGPTGLALDESRGSLYVLNRFDGSISVVSLATETERTRLAFFDPTPGAIKIGRKHLYDTHLNSGLGQISCASCHVDARMDRLAWDLGDPSGTMQSLGNNNLGFGLPGLNPATTNPAFQPFHPMKGPMTTQTMQDIIGQEPLHWRGDRAGLEDFAHAFAGLQGDDTDLSAAEMQEFENYLATVTFPPNPFRNFDNTLPTNLPLPGHFRTGRFGAAGTPLPNGNAVNGLALYRNTTTRLDNGAFACVTCHTLPTGAGPDVTLVGTVYQNVPVGPRGEHHRALVSVDGSTNLAIKIPQIRNVYEKKGFNTTQLINTSGFGLLHDGSVDSIERFVSEPVFRVTSDQQVADLTALVLAFSGSDMPQGAANTPLEPPGGTSLDTHAAVGTQTTLRNSAAPDPGQTALIASMLSLADQNKVGVIARGRLNGQARGWTYTGAGIFQSDRAGETIAASALQAGAAPGSEITYTVVPNGAQMRLGIDADLDGILDGNEAPPCIADVDNGTGTGVPDGGVGIEDILYYLALYDAGVIDADVDDGTMSGTRDGGIGIEDLLYYLARYEAGC